MKKVSIVSLVLVLILVLGSLVSCQEPDEKEVIKEVTVTNLPAEKTFPAPANVSTIVNPDNSTELRITWTVVHSAINYFIYFRANDDGNMLEYPVTTWTYTNASYYSKSNTIYVNVSQTFYSKLVTMYDVGVCAISYDGIKSPIKWAGRI